MKTTVLESCTYLKRDSKTDAFLLILQNFYENLFYKTPTLAASNQEAQRSLLLF